jgi:acetyltransferase
LWEVEYGIGTTAHEYPPEYSKIFVMRDGSEVRLRPIRPEDEPMMVRFHHALSEESVHSRYFHMIRLEQRVAHERLTKICSPDHRREMAIVAEHTDPAGASEILGVGRMVRLEAVNEAELAVIVSDAYQRHGVGSELVRLLLDVARRENLGRLVAIVLPQNHAVQDVLRHLGFHLRYSTEEQAVIAELCL